jgi:thiol-disulfide isomerase/thioredoxin
MTNRRSSKAAPRRTRDSAATRGARFDARWILGGAAVVVVVAALAAVVLARPDSTGAGSLANGSPPGTTPSFAGSATALPAFVATTGDPAVGRPIPEVTGRSFDGSPVAIRADGRPKLLLFLAHWCPHCQREVPVVQAWLDAGRLPGSVDLISVATATDPARPNYPPSDWLRRERWRPPVLADTSNDVADRFGLSAFPYWIAVRADGTVATRVTGELSPAQLDVLAGSVGP